MLYSTKYALNIYQIFILSFKMYYNIIQPRTLFPSKVEGQTLGLASTFCYLIGPLINDNMNQIK